MASLSEMIQYANYTNKINDPTAPLRSGFQGFQAGRKDRLAREKATSQAKTATADFNLKLAKFSEEVRKNRREQESNETVTRLLKSFGILPLSPQEQAQKEQQELANRKNIFDSFGSKPEKKATIKSKLSEDWLTNISIGGGKTVVNLKQRNPEDAEKKRNQKILTDSRKSSNFFRLKKEALTEAVMREVQNLPENMDAYQREIEEKRIKTKLTVDSSLVNKLIPAMKAQSLGNSAEYERIIKEVYDEEDKKKLKNDLKYFTEGFKQK